MADGFNPRGIWGPDGRAFSQGVIQGEGMVVHVTGQVAWDADGKVVGAGDVATQMEKCIDNIKAVLAEVGGTLDDVVSLTIYFLRRDDPPAIQRVRARHFKPATAPVSILIQVPGLVVPEFLIELVPIAVVPPTRFKRPS
jgi:enamine deaminase RidA (YjgF/YER057c/UK114 family)